MGGTGSGSHLRGLHFLLRTAASPSLVWTLMMFAVAQRAAIGFGHLSFNLTLTHSHTLTIICTCCCDETKGTQDQDFSCSFSDSLSDSLSLIGQDSLLCIYLYTLTITHSHTLSITCTWCHDEIKGTQDKDFSCSFSDSLSLSLRSARTKEATPVGLAAVGFEIESREVVVDCIGWHQWHGRGDQRVKEIM